MLGSLHDDAATPQVPRPWRMAILSDQVAAMRCPREAMWRCATTASTRLDSLWGSDQQHIGAAYCEQSDSHDAANLVELALQSHRIGDHQPVDIEDVIAVVGDEPLAPHGTAATRRERAGYQRTGQG